MEGMRQYNVHRMITFKIRCVVTITLRDAEDWDFEIFVGEAAEQLTSICYLNIICVQSNIERFTVTYNSFIQVLKFRSL